MRILTRHLVARFLGLFAAFLSVATATIVIVELLVNFRDMFEMQPGIQGIAGYLFLRVPSYYLPDVLPIAAFAASFFTLGLAARWLEVVAVKAGGISIQRAALPLLAAGGVLAGVSFALNETVVLGATREWNRMDDDGRDLVTFREGSFWYHKGQTIYNIADADPASRTLRGVQIFELDERGRPLRSIEAERVAVDAEQRWHFEGAVVRHFDPDDAMQSPVTERREGEIPIADGGDTAWMRADASNLSLPMLQDAIQSQRSRGRDPMRFEALFHERLSEPAALWIFVLAAIPLGAQVESAKGVAIPALRGILIVASFHLARSLGTSLASEGLVPAAASIWTVVAGFAAFATWRFARIPS